MYVYLEMSFALIEVMAMEIFEWLDEETNEL